MGTDDYRIIQEKMDAHPLGAPADPSFTEILKLYLSPEEAAVVARMELSPMTADQIAALTGKPAVEITQMLEELAARGLIFLKRKQDITYYRLVPPMPGIFEFTLMKGERSELAEAGAQLL